MTADKTRVLDAERLEPLTAAEHAAEFGHLAEYARDVPRACACLWTWDPDARRYARAYSLPGCPWDGDHLDLG